MDFKIIVVLIAVLILALMLTLVWYSIHLNNTQGTIYPPTKNPCPDAWLMDASGNCVLPMKANLGNLNPASYSAIPGFIPANADGNRRPAVNFSDPAWSASGMTPTCAQKLWANSNGIVWDTISNYNQC